MWLCGEEYTVENRATISIINRTMDAKGFVMSHGSPWSGASLIQVGENNIEVKAVYGGDYGFDTVKVITKYDPSGLPGWIRILGDEAYDNGSGIAVDSSGNSYVVGNTSGLYGEPNSAFIAKYDIFGNQVWLKRFFETPGARLALFKDVAVDKDGGVYITGYRYIYTADATEYISFIEKYDASGNQLWLKEFGGIEYIKSEAITVDKNGFISVTGSIYSGQDLFGNADIFVAKYDVSGNRLWLKQFGTNREDVGQLGSADQDIAIDANGNIYITGTTLGSFVCHDGASTLNDVFLMKIDTDGNQIWVEQFCSEENDYGDGIAVDEFGNSYITGTRLVGSGWNVTYYDAFIAKYDTLGNQLWINLFGYSHVDMGNDIAVNPSGSIDVVGWTYNQVSTLGDVVDDALFIAKYDASGQQISIRQFYVPHKSSTQVNRIAIDEAGGSTVMSATYSTGSRNDVYITRLHP
jgi:hypothetical protein